jgi:ATP-dependent DNA helicase RecG
MAYFGVVVVLNSRMTLDSPVAALPKAKPLDQRRLVALGILTVRDLLLHLPFAWDEFGEPKNVSELTEGALATVAGTIRRIAPKISKYKRLEMTQALLVDDNDDELNIVWFHQPWVAKQLHAGDRVAVAGTVKASRFGPEMRNPHHEVLDGANVAAPRYIGGLMPRYHLVKGLTSKKLAGWVDAALPLADQLEDELPEDVRERHRLLPLAQAVRLGHKPETQSQWSEARRRMGFAELFELQAAFALMRASLAAEPAVPIPYRQDVIDAFKSGLGFELTTAQRRSMWEAFKDMDRPSPMNRLLNGDRDPCPAAPAQVPELSRRELSRPDRRAAGQQSGHC